MKTRIKELRARHNLSQQELADLVDVRRETISHLERGTYNPSLQLAYDISCVLDSKIEDVFIIEERKYVENGRTAKTEILRSSNAG